MKSLILLFISYSLVCSANYDTIDTPRLTSHKKFQTKNFFFVDWNNPSRNQGAIGSCQSFAFLGLIENSVYHDQGVSFDLSERYQLYSNYVHFGALGSSLDHTSRLREVVSRMGAIPEALYPYDELNQNEASFQVDSAQGLERNAAPEIDLAVAGKTEEERIQILQETRFFGQLPQGSYPVHIPLKSQIDSEKANVRYVSLKERADEFACFSEKDERYKLALSPQEFATHCLKFDESQFSDSGALHAGLSTEEIQEGCQDPAKRQAHIDKLGQQSILDIEKILKGLIVKKPTMIGTPVPDTMEGKTSVIWHSKMSLHAGHAVIALGYITADDLATPAMQRQGLLASGLYDEMAKKLDPNYILPPAEFTNEQLAKWRSDSELGTLITEGQGAVLVRNSWGEVPGVSGYQFLTFEFLAANNFLYTNSFGDLMESGPKPTIKVTDYVKSQISKLLDQTCQ